MGENCRQSAPQKCAGIWRKHNIMAAMFLRRLASIIVFALCGAMLVACGAGTAAVQPESQSVASPELQKRSVDWYPKPGTNWTPHEKWCEKNGHTFPLHCAAGYGDLHEIRQLIANGVEIDRATKNKSSPLFFAALVGQVEAISVLIKAGADINWVRNDGLTPLHVAAEQGHAAVIDVLISEGAYPNAVATNGDTPIGKAIQWKSMPSIKSLVSGGANLNIKNKDGVTPLHEATRAKNIAAMKILIENGADIQAIDGWGNNPLHIAVRAGSVDAVNLLVQAGADIHTANKHGEMPMDIARHFKKWSVVSVLEKLYETNPPQPSPKEISPEESVPNVAVAPAPESGNVAEHVFENAWRSVVYIRTNDGQGSGVIIHPNVVATNCHVVDGGGIFVYKAENRRTAKTRYRAFIRRADDENDFCLLDVKGLWGIPATNVRRYDTLRVGESVYGLGAPQGLDLSMSTGIISQKRAAKGVRYIQTDVAISPGSSGGGLFDREGNLVGIMTAKIVGEDVEGIGFAIPADLALE